MPSFFVTGLLRGFRSSRSVEDDEDGAVNREDNAMQESHSWVKESDMNAFETLSHHEHASTPGSQTWVKADDDLESIASSSSGASTYFSTSFDIQGPAEVPTLDEERVATARDEDVPDATAQLEHALRELQEHKGQIQALQDELAVAQLTTKTREEEIQQKSRQLTEADVELAVALQRYRELEAANRQHLQSIRASEGRISALETAKADVDSRTDILARQLQSLEAEVAQTRLQKVALETEVLDLRSTSLSAAHRVMSLRQELESVLLSKEELQNRNSSQEVQITLLEKELVTLRDKLTALQADQSGNRQVESTERLNKMLQDQLRQQSSDLRRASSPTWPVPVFVDHDFPGGVVGMVETLTTEILQTSAIIADCLDFSNLEGLSSQGTQAAVERAARIMGRPLILALRMTGPEPDPLPIQIALQASFCYCCSKIIEAWYPGHWEYSDFLAALYSRIQGTENDHDIRQWRSITRARLVDANDNDLLNEMEAFVMEGVVDVLTIAGWNETNDREKALASMFGERITAIVQIALRLNATVGDEWKLIYVYPDEPLNEATMELTYPSDEGDQSSHDDYVVCTTDLGLFNEPDGSHVVFKAKVVLENIF